jgi:NAD+ kinase
MTASNSIQIANIGILVNPRKEEVWNYLVQIDNWIESSNINTRFAVCTYDSKYLRNSLKNIDYKSEKEILNHSDLIITLGGDGTILRSVQAIGNLKIPILGINLGGLGFLADTPPESMLQNLKSIISGDFLIEKRSALQLKNVKTNQVFTAFNDIVIDKSGFSRVIEINTDIDDHFLNSYIADGVIISTPTGSTGYSLSAGGPILVPQTNVFVINPICPHSLTNRPVVVSDKSKIKLEVFTEYKEINIYRDGQCIGSFPSGSVFEIVKAEYSVNLIKMKNTSFYSTLRNKLHWGEDFRDKKRWTFNDLPNK